MKAIDWEIKFSTQFNYTYVLTQKYVEILWNEKNFTHISGSSSETGNARDLNFSIKVSINVRMNLREFCFLNFENNKNFQLVPYCILMPLRSTKIIHNLTSTQYACNQLDEILLRNMFYRCQKVLKIWKQ